MNATAPVAPPPRRHNRRVLLLLAAVAAFPFVASWLLYFNPHWLPDPSAQHGTLLEPPLAYADLALTDLEGRPYVLDPGRNGWLLLVIEPSACDLACRHCRATAAPACTLETSAAFRSIHSVTGSGNVK